VHGAKTAQEREQILYMMKLFVDPHFVRLLHNVFSVRSIDEYGTFLSLPHDLETLRKQRDRLRRALRFRERESEL